MSLLTIIQDVCRRVNLTVPGAVVASTAPNIIQLYGLAQEEGEELQSYDFKQLERRVTFQSVAQENQGALTTLAPDYDRMIGETCWDLSSQMFQGGYVSPQDWEVRKVRNITGPTYRMRLMTDPTTLQNSLLLNPAPAAGHTMGFEYYSKYWCAGVNVGPPVTYTGKTAWTADTDIPLLDERLFKLGIRWRWKKEKGFAYAEDYNSYVELRDSLISQADSTGAIALHQHSDPVLIGPWNLPDGNYDQ